MTRIVTAHHRYKRPPGKRAKATAIEPAVVTIRIRKQAKRADAPALTPEEIRHRVDAAADSMWRQLVRRATRKDRL
jgi:hypothetical protein